MISKTECLGALKKYHKAIEDSLGADYTLPTASASVKGGVIIGDGLSMIGDTLNVTISGGISYADFTGATSITGGLSGLVPAPAAGEEGYFLRGDGNWVDNSGTVLSTVASTVDGGFWYEVLNGEPVLKLYHDNYNYAFAYDYKEIVDVDKELIAYLKFNESTTKDECGNTWTEQGTTGRLSIGTTNVVSGQALQLAGAAYLRLQGQLTFGGQDFTIRFWGYVNSSAPAWCGLFTAQCSLSGGNSSRQGQISIIRNNNPGQLGLGIYSSDGTTSDGGDTTGLTLTDALHHYELDYSHENSTVKFFVDGVLAISASTTIDRLARYIFIGVNGFDTSMTMTGTIDEFQIYDGVALHDNNFTPPTIAN